MVPVRTRSKREPPSNPPLTSTNSVNPRSLPQWSELTDKDYPAPSTPDNVGSIEAFLIHADAPWVQRDAVEDTELLQCCTHGDGWLPGNFPLAITENSVWREQFFYRNSGLWVGNRREMSSSKREFFYQAYSGFYRLKTFNIITSELSLDSFLFCTRGEESHALNLAENPTDTIEAYRGVFDVEHPALLLDSALLRIEFRYKKVPSVFKECFKHEDETRSSHGLAFPYQFLTLY